MGLIADIKQVIANLLPDNNSQAISAEDARLSHGAVLDNWREISAEQIGDTFDFSTYSNMIAIDGAENVVYKVSNDPDSSKNGYYHWTGSVYLKDADLYPGDVNLISFINDQDYNRIIKEMYIDDVSPLNYTITKSVNRNNEVQLLVKRNGVLVCYTNYQASFNPGYLKLLEWDNSGILCEIIIGKSFDYADISGNKEIFDYAFSLENSPILSALANGTINELFNYIKGRALDSYQGNRLLNTSIDLLQVIDDKYLLEDGSLVPASTYKVVEFSVMEQNFIKIPKYFSVGAYLVFTDDLDNVLESTTNSDPLGTVERFEIPYGATKVKISVLTSKIADMYYYIGIDMNSLVLHNINYLKSGTVIPINYDVDETYVVGSNGQVVQVGGTDYDTALFVDFSQLAGKTISVYVTFQDLAGIAFFDEKRNYISGVTGSSYVYKTYNNIDVPLNCKYAHLCSKGSIGVVKYNDTTIKLSSILTGRDSSYNDISLPKYLYAVENTSTQVAPREYVTTIPIEGVSEQDSNVLMNKEREISTYVLKRNNAIKEDYTVNVDLSRNGFEAELKTVTVRKTRESNLNDSTVLYQYMGDSLGDLGANEIIGDDTSNELVISSQVQLLSKLASIDYSNPNINIKTIGTIPKPEVNKNYKGENIQFTSYNESRGSRAAAGYLRHALYVAPSSTNPLVLSGQAAWDSLGLTTAQGAYTGSVADHQLIGMTCHNFHTPDYSNELWDWMKLKYPTIVTESAYNSGDLTQMIAAFNQMIDFPENVFYRKETAISSGGAYAFSYAKYLERYKTLESDGVTRLIVGSTAGTLVTDVNDYDVVLPTHLSIEFGINDNVWFNFDAAMVFSDLQLLESRCRAAGIPNIAMFITRYNGNWDNNTVLYLDSPKHNWDINELLKNEYQDTLNGVTYLPIYHTQPKIGGYQEGLLNTFNGKSQIWYGLDRVHYGINQIKNAAYQIYSWINYTL